MDYLSKLPERELYAAQFVEDEDAAHHGVMGMKWGQRRNRAQLKAAAAKRGDAKPDGDKNPDGSAKPKAAESSQERYARIASVAKTNGAKVLSDDDLKFFNARTEAIKKIDALSQTDPSWLNETIKKVGQESTKKAMKDVTDATVQHLLTGPIIKKITATAS